jgi:hypothetical protein
MHLYHHVFELFAKLVLPEYLFAARVRELVHQLVGVKLGHLLSVELRVRTLLLLLLLFPF